jgi:hypothetical protein
MGIVKFPMPDGTTTDETRYRMGGVGTEVGSQLWCYEPVVKLDWELVTHHGLWPRAPRHRAAAPEHAL